MGLPDFYLLTVARAWRDCMIEEFALSAAMAGTLFTLLRACAKVNGVPLTSTFDVAASAPVTVAP